MSLLNNYEFEILENKGVDPKLSKSEGTSQTLEILILYSVGFDFSAQNLFMDRSKCCESTNNKECGN